MNPHDERPIRGGVLPGLDPRAEAAGYGIDIQMRDVQAFATQQGLVVAHVYRDEAESGVKEDRRQLRRLLRDCRAGRVRAVVVPRIDRLSRSVRIAENVFHELEQLGVEVLIADMPTYNGKDRRDVLVRQIREAIAEENRKDIIERLWKGRQERVRRGLPPGGNVPYGYRREAKGLVADAAEAEGVRMIFEFAERQDTGAAIARTLNAKGLTRRNGKPWTPRQVTAILTRAALYRDGCFRYGAVSGADDRLALLGSRLDADAQGHGARHSSAPD